MQLTSETPRPAPEASYAMPLVNQLSIDPEYAEEHDRRILVVDDDDAVRNLFSSYLNETYTCETAGNAQEALEILARQPFALVLSDIQMPGLGGIELLRKIIERYPETAVIMISGVDRTQRVIDAIRVGAYDYLLKPCELDVLSASVHRALERRLLLRNASRYKRDLEIRNTELARQQAELQRLQAQIIQNEKMASLGLMAAGVAHEINNPAGFIYSNVDLLRKHVADLESCLSEFDQLALPDDLVAQVRNIKDKVDYENLVNDLDSILADCSLGAERIRDVIKNLRLFSRLDEAEIKRVDLNESIDATLRLLSIYYKAGNIKVERDYGDLPPINCYAAQLNQVWMNLLVNAAQAIGKEPGEVRITTRCAGATVTISFADSGKGIPAQHLKQVFDPFFTTKPIGEGTGLGLSISHGIVEQHGGTIRVESNAGSGTIFTITLPVDTEEATNPEN